MGGLVCAVHRRKNKGFPTLKRTLNLGIEKGRLLKNSRPKGGLIQVICYPTSPETVDITGFFEKFCIAIRTKKRQAPRVPAVFYFFPIHSSQNRTCRLRGTGRSGDRPLQGADEIPTAPCRGGYQPPANLPGRAMRAPTWCTANSHRARRPLPASFFALASNVCS